MKRGKLTEIVEAFRPVDAINAYGETERSWVSAGRWHAQRKDFTGRSVEEVAEIFADYSATFIIDYAHKPEEGWRLEYLGRLYVIGAVEPNRQRGLKVVKCNRLNP